jgi:hypothetical protein
MFPVFLYGQEIYFSIINDNKDLKKSVIIVEGELDSIFRSNIDIDKLPIRFVPWPNSEILLLYNESYMIIILRGSEFNTNRYRTRIGCLLINKLPKEKGTYILAVGDDSNNPYYCNADDLTWKHALSDSEEGRSKYQEWKRCADTLIYERDNQYYRLSEDFGFEITEDGLSRKFINEYVPALDEFLLYLRNKELQPPCPLSNTINIIKDYYRNYFN